MTTPQRKGILGEKLGMTQVWDEANRLVPVTVVKAGPCVVTLVRTADGEASHLSSWAGLAKRSPLLAAVFTFLLLARSEEHTSELQSPC